MCDAATAAAASAAAGTHQGRVGEELHPGLRGRLGLRRRRRRRRRIGRRHRRRHARWRRPAVWAGAGPGRGCILLGRVCACACVRARVRICALHACASLETEWEGYANSEEKESAVSVSKDIVEHLSGGRPNPHITRLPETASNLPGQGGGGGYS
jgi:hypothetical protein